MSVLLDTSQNCWNGRTGALNLQHMKTAKQFLKWCNESKVAKIIFSTSFFNWNLDIWKLVIISEYIVKPVFFKIVIFIYSASSMKTSHHDGHKWKYVKYVIFLIYSDIKLSSSRYCWPYERWEELLYPDIWFSYFIHSRLGDCGPYLCCMNLLKNCQDPGVFLVVMNLSQSD